MRNAFKTAFVVGAMALVAAPAFGAGPETGAQHRPTATPPYSGTDNPGTDRRPATRPVTPASKRALGQVCRAQGESKSNANDPEPGTPFSRCVKALAQSIKAACKDESKSNANDPDRGTPYSRCVSDLARGLRAGTATSDRGLARSACRKADFDSGREYGACVSTLAKALRRV